MAGGLELDDLYSRFQPKPFYDSMISSRKVIPVQNHLWYLKESIVIDQKLNSCSWWFMYLENMAKG